MIGAVCSPGPLVRGLILRLRSGAHPGLCEEVLRTVEQFDPIAGIIEYSIYSASELEALSVDLLGLELGWVILVLTILLLLHPTDYGN